MTLPPEVAMAPKWRHFRRRRWKCHVIGKWSSSLHCKWSKWLIFMEGSMMWPRAPHESPTRSRYGAEMAPKWRKLVSKPSGSYYKQIFFFSITAGGVYHKWRFGGRARFAFKVKEGSKQGEGSNNRPKSFIWAKGLTKIIKIPGVL